MPLEGTLLGHYQLQRLLGSGGAGEVYLAEDTRIARQVAVKVIRTESTLNMQETQEIARLFQREMRAITLLDHPNILPLYDFGEQRTQNATLTYMVMPYRPDGSLADWLRQRDGQSLSPEDTAYFVSQAAEALQHAHDHGIVHQDVKPSNFLIRSRTGHPNRPGLLLADFGIAKITTGVTAISQSIRGTPTYMAPEQWDGQPVAASDQYALAIMAYQLLTGRVPFTGRMEQVMRQHFAAQPQPPTQLNPRISQALNAVILRALAKQPQARFPSAAAFARAFQEATQPSLQAMPSTPTPAGFNAGLFHPGLPFVNVVPSTPPSHPGLVTREFAAPPPPPTPVSNPGFSMQMASATGSVPMTPDAQAFNLPNSQRSITVAKKVPMKVVAPIVLVVILLVLSSVVVANLNQRRIDEDNAATSTHVALTATATASNPTAVSLRATAAVFAANAYPAYLVGPLKEHGTLAFVDAMSKPGHWRDNVDQGFGGSCLFTNGTYHVKQTIANKLFSCNSLQDFSDLTVEVEMTITQGDCGGIGIRNDSHNDDYVFRVCQDGHYFLDFYASDQAHTKTLFDRTSSAIHTGLNATNTIAFKAQGPQLTFYINQQQVDATTDKTYSRGSLSLVASAPDHPTEVVYNRVRVWTL